MSQMTSKSDTLELGAEFTNLSRAFSSAIRTTLAMCELADDTRYQVTKSQGSDHHCPSIEILGKPTSNDYVVQLADVFPNWIRMQSIRHIDTCACIILDQIHKLAIAFQRQPITDIELNAICKKFNDVTNIEEKYRLLIKQTLIKSDDIVFPFGFSGLRNAISHNGGFIRPRDAKQSEREGALTITVLSFEIIASGSAGSRIFKVDQIIDTHEFSNADEPTLISVRVTKDIHIHSIGSMIQIDKQSLDQIAMTFMVCFDALMARICEKFSTEPTQ